MEAVPNIESFGQRSRLDKLSRPCPLHPLAVTWRSANFGRRDLTNREALISPDAS